MIEGEGAMRITILGGTGKLGKALGICLAELDHNIIIGSRSKERAQIVAEEINASIGKEKANGCKNEESLNGSQLVILAIPGQERKSFIKKVASDLKGKVVLDVTVPLQPGPIFRYSPPAAGSNAQETEQLIGDGSTVVAGFHTVSAGLLKEKQTRLGEDVLVAGNSAEAKEMVLELIKTMGMRGFDAGPLENSPIIESLTALIINLNKKYKRKHIGIKLTGI